MGLLQGALSIRGLFPPRAGLFCEQGQQKKGNPTSDPEETVNPACRPAGRLEPVSAYLVLKY